MIKLSDDTCKMINAYENGACLDGINKWMLSGFVIRFISFSSSFLERVIVRQIVRIGRRIENGSIRSKIVQNVIKMSFVLILKKKNLRIFFDLEFLRFAPYEQTNVRTFVNFFFPRELHARKRKKRNDWRLYNGRMRVSKLAS